MAVTGLLLFFFVVAHLIGNLQFFLGPESINRYGHFLQSNIEVLWPARIGLLVLVFLHIWSAIKLTIENRAARPVSYVNKKTVAASYASRTMIWSGFIILAFIIYHLLHFTATVKAVNLTHRDFGTLTDNLGRHDIFAMIVIGFQNPIVSAFYIFAQFLLFLHLGHGLSAMFQSLGFKNPAYENKIKIFAQVVSWAMFVGYCSIPISVFVRLWQRVCAERAGMKLDSKIPSGPLAQKWDKHKFDLKLVNPANKRKFDVIVVGSGLAGASAAATMAELGYKVKCFCFQDSPRRAHSIAAQGGINAAKNYQNDGDSVYRLFYDTIKGGDFRAREANVCRLAQVSVNIIDQCVAQGVPFAREYGGLLANRSFGGAQVSRTFYARGQTGQQLLLGAYQALSRQIALGTVKMYPRTEMLDIVLIDGHAKGNHRARPGERRDHRARGRCGGAGNRWLWQRVLPFDQRQRLQCDRDLARL